MYHTKRHLVIADEVEAWTLDIAHPYLTTHMPEGYDPDTTDPRAGRFDDSDNDMAVEDDRKMEAIPNEDLQTGWTLLGPNGKPVRQPPPLPTPHTNPPFAAAISATATAHDPPPSFQNPNMPPPNNTYQRSLATPFPIPKNSPHDNGFDPPKVAHNDGTLRITIHWNPPDYATLKPTTGNDLITKATDILHFLLYTAQDCKFHRWDPKLPNPPIPLL